MFKWYEGTILEDNYPNFIATNITGIKEINYYIDYNEFYDEISYVKIKFTFEYEGKEKLLTILFKDIANLYIENFGDSYNQLSGFKVLKVEPSFETQRKYYLEDYEDGSIHFSFKELEIVSID